MGPTGFIQHIERLSLQSEFQLKRKVYTYYSTIKLMRFTVVMEKDEDGIYVVMVPAWPGCICDGRTVEEAMSNIREAVPGFTDDMNADGEPIPHDVDIIGNIELNA